MKETAEEGDARRSFVGCASDVAGHRKAKSRNEAYIRSSSLPEKRGFSASCTNYRFFQLAEICAAHERHDDALSWALQGIERFPKPADERLLDFCVDAYLRRGDAVSANDYAWWRFIARPLTKTFTELMAVAKATNTKAALRERALEHMWSLVKQAEEGVKDRRNAWQPHARSELVSMFLSEQDVDAAWHVFQGGPVSSSLWAELAEARSRTHPHEAISLYHRLLPFALKEGSFGARYDAGVEVGI